MSHNAMAYVVIASAGMAYRYSLQGLYRYRLYTVVVACISMRSKAMPHIGMASTVMAFVCCVAAVVYIVIAYIVMVYGYGPFCG